MVHLELNMIGLWYRVHCVWQYLSICLFIHMNYPRNSLIQITQHSRDCSSLFVLLSRPDVTCPLRGNCAAYLYNSAVKLCSGLRLNHQYCLLQTTNHHRPTGKLWANNCSMSYFVANQHSSPFILGHFLFICAQIDEPLLIDECALFTVPKHTLTANANTSTVNALWTSLHSTTDSWGWLTHNCSCY